MTATRLPFGTTTDVREGFGPVVDAGIATSSNATFGMKMTGGYMRSDSCIVANV